MKTGSGPKVRRLHLVAGSALALVTLTFGLISEGVINQRPFTVVDAQLSDWLQLHRSRRLTSAMFVITTLGANWPVACLTVGFLIYLFSRRRHYWIAAVLSSVFGGMLLNPILKLAFQRPRPSFTEPLSTFTGYSFPSGHTMTATVFFGVVAAYFVAQTPDCRRRVLIALLAGLLIVLVGFSRMYLGAHYLTDVLGAMAEGLAWLSLCLTVIYSLWLRRK